MWNVQRRQQEEAERRAGTHGRPGSYLPRRAERRRGSHREEEALGRHQRHPEERTVSGPHISQVTDKITRSLQSNFLTIRRVISCIFAKLSSCSPNVI